MPTTPPQPAAGYSRRPLRDKLGIKPGFVVAIAGEPSGYRATLGALPDGAVERLTGTTPCDFLHLFTRDRKELARLFPRLKRRLKPDGMLWVSWPKRTAGVETDLDENVVREVGLGNGLVDVKVAAIDLTWSGLKFVFRLADRGKTKASGNSGKEKTGLPRSANPGGPEQRKRATRISR
jgi:hypothetical protein